MLQTVETVDETRHAWCQRGVSVGKGLQGGQDCHWLRVPLPVAPLCNQPINHPTKQPTNKQTNKQTSKPTNQQTNTPTNNTTNQHTNQPTDNQPTNEPSK
jgi:hypothetical protein